MNVLIAGPVTESNVDLVAELVHASGWMGLIDRVYIRDLRGFDQAVRLWCAATGIPFSPIRIGELPSPEQHHAMLDRAAIRAAVVTRSRLAVLWNDDSPWVREIVRIAKVEKVPTFVHYPSPDWTLTGVSEAEVTPIAYEEEAEVEPEWDRARVNAMFEPSRPAGNSAAAAAAAAFEITQARHAEAQSKVSTPPWESKPALNPTVATAPRPVDPLPRPVIPRRPRR